MRWINTLQIHLYAFDELITVSNNGDCCCREPLTIQTNVNAWDDFEHFGDEPLTRKLLENFMANMTTT